MSKSNSKRILFLMSGSIAAYKSCHVISQLVQHGHEVQVVSTPAALEFIGPATLEGLTGRPVASDLYAHGQMMDHIHLARWADVIFLCPATANTINKMAQGIGDDLVTNLFLAHDFKKPFLVAPAMNSAMYQHPITQASLKKLEHLGIKILATGSGNLACGEVGFGRLLEPEQLLAALNEALKKLANTSQTQTPIDPHKKGKVLITSGGTQEPIDAMRVLTNLSTGQTGAYLAEVFFDHGFEVYYLGAAHAVKPQRPCQQFSFSSFNDLDQKLKQQLHDHQFVAVVHAAAVSDFHVARIIGADLVTEPTKQKLSSSQKLTIELEPNFKILPRLKTYAGKNPTQVVGFKFTATENLEERAKAVKKLFAEGGVDWVVHNDQSDIDKQKGLHAFTLHSIDSASAAPNRLCLAEMLCEKFESILVNQENSL